MSSTNNVEKQNSKSVNKDAARKRPLKRLQARKKRLGDRNKHPNHMTERQRLDRIRERLNGLELRFKQVAPAFASVAREDTNEQLVDQLAGMHLQDYHEDDQNLSEWLEWLDRVELRIERVELALASISREDGSQQLADQLAAMHLQGHREQDQNLEADI